jgi:ribokinase
MPDIITIGNALIDSFLSVHDENLHTRINKGDNEACFRLGEKILLDNADFQLGGNACNVGVGLAKAGFSTQLFAEIGEDAFGDMIIKGLTEKHVETDAVLRKGESSFAIGVNFQGDRTLFVHHIEREHNFPFENLTSRLVFLTSLGTKWHHVYKSVAEKKKTANFLLAVNPGTPQIAEGRTGIVDALEVSDILFVNKEEAQAILSTTEEDNDRLLSLLHSLGPKIAVLLDGEEGSFVQDAENTYHLPAKKCDVVEKTGAGDSWATGFLAAHLTEKDIPTSMQWGNANAVSVIGKVGSQAGLLGKDMLEQMAGESEEVTVKKL